MEAFSSIFKRCGHHKAGIALICFIFMEQITTISQRLKELLKHGAIFGLTSSIQSAVAIILLPFYTKFFSVEEFGGYSLILIISAFCQTIFYLGSSSALGRYYYDYKEQDKESEIVSSTLIISVIGGGALVVLSLIFVRTISVSYLGNEEFMYPFLLCMLASVLVYPNTVMTLLLRYKKKSNFYLLVTVGGLLINFAITFSLLYFSDIKLCAPFVGQLVSNFFIAILLLYYVKDSLTFNISKNTYKVILSFGVQVCLSSLLLYAYQSVDKVVMKECLSIADVGIYSLAYRIGSVVYILLILPFALIWAPMRMQYRSSPDNVSFIGKITSYFTLACFLFIVLCMLWGYNILKMLFPQENYNEALNMFPLIMMGFVFNGYLSIFDFGVYISNNLKYYNLILLCCTLFNIGMNLWLLPIFGMKVAAYIFILTYLLSSMLLLFVSNKFVHIPLEWGRLTILYVLGFVSYFIFYEADFIFTNMYLFKLFYTIMVLMVVWITWLNNSEKIKITSIIKARI